MYKFDFYQERVTYKKNDNDSEERSWVPQASVVVEDPVVAAGALRALADKLDPPKKGSY